MDNYNWLAILFGTIWERGGCPYDRDHNGRALEAGMPKLTLGPVSLPVEIWYSSEAGLPG